MLGPHLLRKSEHLVEFPPPSAPGSGKKRKNIGSDGGARSASIGDEAPRPSGAAGCSTSKPPFPHVGDREKIPPAGVSWSPTAARRRPRPFLPSTYPPHPPIRREKSSIAEPQTKEKMVAPAGPRDRSRGTAAVLIRRRGGGERGERKNNPAEHHRSSAVLFEIRSRHVNV